MIVTFFGTPRQISLAKSLVEEKVEEDRELREGIMHRLRSPRSPARQFCLTNSPHEVVIIFILCSKVLICLFLKSNAGGSKRPVEKLSATTQNGFLEVFVSAMKDPGRFWIQVIGRITEY